MTGLYLNLMRARFNQRNDATLDPVPWHLDDKDTAYKHVRDAGYRTPAYTRTSNVTKALRAGNRMGERFVIKQPNRHSTKGVYVLERLGRDHYLELFSMRELTAADIVPDGPPPDYWLAEEGLPSPIAGRPIPLDYKVYAFRGRISHVVQIDRNVYPPRIAVFDGSFVPLQPETDYTTNPDRWLHEHHVIPAHAGQLLEMASTLSAGLDTRFVRVDCYDTHDGPVFGEFTFASGPDDVGMLMYSTRIMEALDRAMGGEDIPSLSGFGATRPSGVALDAPRRVIERLSASAIQGDTRYATTGARYVPESPSKAIWLLALNMVGYLNGDGSRAFSIQAALRGSQFSNDRLREFADAALEFHDARSANPWHASRAAEVRLADGEPGALDVLRTIASTGFVHAQRVVAANTR